MKKVSTGTHNSPMLRDQYDRFLHSGDLMEKLGFKRGAHLPREGFDRVVDGVRFVCRPAIEITNPYTGRPQRTGKGHRLLFQCKCNRLIPFGRANQHKCEETRRG